jgi:hypothetical protein
MAIYSIYRNRKMADSENNLIHYMSLLYSMFHYSIPSIRNIIIQYENTEIIRNKIYQISNYECREKYSL